MTKIYKIQGIARAAKTKATKAGKDGCQAALNVLLANGLPMEDAMRVAVAL